MENASGARRFAARYWPTFIVGIIILATPVLYGIVLADTYALVDPFDHFDLAISNLLPLLFPLLATFLYGLSFSAELVSSYWMPAHTRLGRVQYVTRHVFRAAFIGAAVFFTVIAIWGVYTMMIAPALELIVYYPRNGTLPPAERSTWTQLMTYGPLVYFAGYGAWVALHGAIYGALAVTVLINVPNRVLALLLPFVAAFVIDFVLANLGLGSWGAIPTVFASNLTQGPLWVPILCTLPIVAIAAWLYARAISTRRPAPAFQ